MQRISADHLRTVATRIYEALGVPHDIAQFVVNSLVNANLTGHDSHGVIYVKRYAEMIKNGFIVPNARPSILRETAATGIVDGHWGFGQVTARQTMHLAIQKASSTGVGVVSGKNCNHVGRLGEWAMLAVDHNMLGILVANLPHAIVQPYGGAVGVLGTNPFSVAAPADKMPPFLVDFATSAVAEGKVTLAAIKGESIPLGWIVDHSGKDTENPSDLYPAAAAECKEQGRLLTFGARDGHKGYCLSILVEVLGGILTGSGCVTDENLHPSQNGLLAFALNIDSFTHDQTFRRQMDKLYRYMHNTPVIAGFPYDQVQVPGEPEWHTRESRLKEGIPLPDPIWVEILNLASELGVHVDR